MQDLDLHLHVHDPELNSALHESQSPTLATMIVSSPYPQQLLCTHLLCTRLEIHA